MVAEKKLFLTSFYADYLKGARTADGDAGLFFGALPAQGEKIDQFIALASFSNAIDPSLEFPAALRPGDQTAIDATPGTTPRIPPPTPLLPEMPTLNAKSPDPS